ncbi:hypothetical protein EGC86_00655 [Shewanella frigidimarina]|nr:hypothetical protein EGC86_00655 [Shewanella frigidimarina]
MTLNDKLAGRIFGHFSCEGNDGHECTEMERMSKEVLGSNLPSDASDTINQLKETFGPNKIDCSVYPRPMIYGIRK